MLIKRKNKCFCVFCKLEQTIIYRQGFEQRRKIDKMTRIKVESSIKNQQKQSHNTSHKVRIFDEISLMSSKTIKPILYKNVIYITIPHRVAPSLLVWMYVLTHPYIWPEHYPKDLGRQKYQNHLFHL